MAPAPVNSSVILPPPPFLEGGDCDGAGEAAADVAYSALRERKYAQGKGRRVVKGEGRRGLEFEDLDRDRREVERRRE